MNLQKLLKSRGARAGVVKEDAPVEEVIEAVAQAMGHSSTVFDSFCFRSFKSCKNSHKY